MANYKGLHLSVERDGELISGIGTGKGSVISLSKVGVGNYRAIEIALKEFSQGNKIHTSIEPERKFTREESVSRAMLLIKENNTVNGFNELIQYCILGKKTSKTGKQFKKYIPSGNRENLGLFVATSVAAALLIGFTVHKLIKK